MSIVLAGAAEEVLWLARALDVAVDAVVDPHIDGPWYGYELYRTDGEALSAVSPDGVIISSDIPKVRQAIDAAYTAAGVAPVDLLGGTFHATAEHGPGLMLQTGALVSTSGRLGRGVRINIKATVMHEAVIGDYVTIAPAAVVLGRVTIGARAYIGANATILPGITIGSDAVVGAGAVVTRDVADGAVVKGVPAK